MTAKTEPKAIVGRTLTGYDRPVAVNGVLIGHASFAKCYPLSWWNFQPADGGRLEQHADLSRVRDRAVVMYKRSLERSEQDQASKDTAPSILEQLASLGYRLLTGTARFHSAMSLGLNAIAQDQVGSPVMISCENGILSIAPAAPATRRVAEFQVHRIHLAN